MYYVLPVDPLESSHQVQEPLVTWSLGNTEGREAQGAQPVVGSHDDDVPLYPGVGSIGPPLVTATVEISSEDPEHDWQFVPRRGGDGSVDREVETVLGAADPHLPLVEVAVLGALDLQVLAGVPHLRPPTGRLGRGKPGTEDDISGQYLDL